MNTTTQRVLTSQKMLWLMATLLVISAVLFLVGSVIERNSPKVSETVPTQPATGEAGEANPETGNPSEIHPGSESSEAIFGFNLENPWLKGGFAVISLLLAVGLLRWKEQVFLPIIVIVGATTLLDFRETLFQMKQLGHNIAVIAGIITSIHAVIVLLAILSMWAYRASEQAGMQKT